MAIVVDQNYLAGFGNLPHERDEDGRFWLMPNGIHTVSTRDGSPRYDEFRTSPDVAAQNWFYLAGRGVPTDADVGISSFPINWEGFRRPPPAVYRGRAYVPRITTWQFLWYAEADETEGYAPMSRPGIIDMSAPVGPGANPVAFRDVLSPALEGYKTAQDFFVRPTPFTIPQETVERIIAFYNTMKALENQTVRVVNGCQSYLFDSGSHPPTIANVSRTWALFGVWDYGYDVRTEDVQLETVGGLQIMPAILDSDYSDQYAPHSFVNTPEAVHVTDQLRDPDAVSAIAFTVRFNPGVYPAVMRRSLIAARNSPKWLEGKIPLSASPVAEHQLQSCFVMPDMFIVADDHLDRDLDLYPMTVDTNEIEPPLPDDVQFLRNVGDDARVLTPTRGKTGKHTVEGSLTISSEEVERHINRGEIWLDGRKWRVLDVAQAEASLYAVQIYRDLHYKSQVNRPGLIYPGHNFTTLPKINISVPIIPYGKREQVILPPPGS